MAAVAAGDGDSDAAVGDGEGAMRVVVDCRVNFD